MTSYEALRSRAAFIDFSRRGKIRVTGEDRARFLHAMSTNHVSGLKSGHGLYSFFLTAQGRIIADAYIYNHGDSFLMDTDAELASKLTEHLDRFIIADDVELHNESELWSAAGLEGPDSIQLASALGVPIPEESFGVSRWDDGFVAKTSASGPVGLRLFVPRSEFRHLREKFAELAIPEASAPDVEIVRLENGVPRYGSDFSERHLVGETGLTHGVHPNKGCYVGQEIVERVRSRAQLHRQLRQLRISGSVTPLAGAKLVSNGKDAGEVTSAAFSPALGGVVALGYVRTEAAAGENLLSVAGLEPPATASIVSQAGARAGD